MDVKRKGELIAERDAAAVAAKQVVDETAVYLAKLARRAATYRGVPPPP